MEELNLPLLLYPSSTICICLLLPFAQHVTKGQVCRLFKVGILDLTPSLRSAITLAKFSTSQASKLPEPLTTGTIFMDTVPTV
jgi:hypothetical protein